MIDIQYSGICHSDIHQVNNEWGGSIFPMVPGHEIVGIVSQVGTNVTRFKVGGYSDKIVVDENYVLRISDNLPLDRAAPLMCAGITLYSPLMHWKLALERRLLLLALVV